MSLSRVTVIMVAVMAVEATVVEVDGAAVVAAAMKTKWEAWAVVLGQSIGEPKNSSVSRRTST
jgi:hypothetical protein